MRGRIATPVRERLAARLVPAPGGCLLWPTVIGDTGYGQIEIAGRMRLAHRVAWELDNGPVPDGLVLDHLCRVRNCANVAHLELVTQRENILRGVGPTAVNAAKKQCDSGHKFDLLNTYWRPGGGRGCRTCRRETARQARAARALQSTP